MLYSIILIFSRLPLFVLYILSDALCFLLYHIIRYRKGVILQNLKHAFPNANRERPLSLSKGFYSHLCDLFVEHIKGFTISPSMLKKHLKIQNIEMLEKLHAQGQSIILVTGHIGNWEWVAHALACQTPYEICAGYQRLHHTSLDQAILRLRSRFQRKAVPIASLYRAICQHKGSPQAITLLIDQAPLHKPYNSYLTHFLSQSTHVALTAAKLAKRCNYPMFYVQIEKYKRGYYNITLVKLSTHPAAQSVEALTEAYMRKLEANILQQPSCWLWSHRRWK